MNEPMLFCFVIGEFISVTMNEPMLFSFVIDEFCSNRSNLALHPSASKLAPPLRQRRSLGYAVWVAKSKTSQ